MLEKEIREIENLEKTGGIDTEIENLQIQKRGLEKLLEYIKRKNETV